MSSVGPDFVVERNLLAAYAWPKLRSWAAKRGLQLKASPSSTYPRVLRIAEWAKVVDMRWGVRDAVSQNHEGAAMCVREVPTFPLPSPRVGPGATGGGGAGGRVRPVLGGHGPRGAPGQPLREAAAPLRSRPRGLCTLRPICGRGGKRPAAGVVRPVPKAQPYCACSEGTDWTRTRPGAGSTCLNRAPTRLPRPCCELPWVGPSPPPPRARSASRGRTASSPPSRRPKFAEAAFHSLLFCWLHRRVRLEVSSMQSGRTGTRSSF